MSFTSSILARSYRAVTLGAMFSLGLGLSAFAGDITVSSAYARASGANAKSGAIFMQIENSADTDDRLIAAATPAARKAELHTHIMTDQGVMQMREVKDGFVIPAQDVHMLARGGDHVMLMGLTGPLVQGDMVELTLTFEKAGELTLEVPVDMNRGDMPGQTMKHDTRSGG
ncbi:MAG: copper chaperone PCu(A)C [Rhodobacteraceae bacterium]|nr:copper chaperone PCu(A)C [Paracoccaceae bacterium]